MYFAYVYPYLYAGSYAPNLYRGSCMPFMNNTQGFVASSGYPQTVYHNYQTPASGVANPSARQSGFWGFAQKTQIETSHSDQVQDFQEIQNLQVETSDNLSRKEQISFKDHGGQPFVIDINEASKQNNTYRTAIWTGEHLQVTVMSIDVGEDIGLEVHPDTDQFLRIEAGEGLVQMGDTKENLNFEKSVRDDDAIMVPAGKWHNLTNTGKKPLKLYTIYAPPEHPFGTVHRTKAEAMAEEAVKG